MRREVGTLGPEREGGVYLGMILGKVDLWRGGERLLLLSGLKERSRMHDSHTVRAFLGLEGADMTSSSE